MGAKVKNTIPKVLTGKQKYMRTHAKAFMENAMEAGRSEVVTYTPVKTGRLKGSIGIIKRITITVSGIFKGIFGTNVSYAGPVEFGTSKRSGRHMFKQGLNSLAPTFLSLAAAFLKKINNA